MRALADAENARKRSEKDRREAENMAAPSWPAICCPFMTT